MSVSAKYARSNTGKVNQHAQVMKSGDHGGFSGTSQGQESEPEDGPGYPMSQHGGQMAERNTRGGGRAAGASHSNTPGSEKYPPIEHVKGGDDR
jgi:transcription initiation factor TFIID subunit TAF12